MYFINLLKLPCRKMDGQLPHDPYELRVGGVEMYIDLAAEQLISSRARSNKDCDRNQKLYWSFCNFRVSCCTWAIS
jgi:hypothetical protein